MANPELITSTPRVDPVKSSTDVMSDEVYRASRIPRSMGRRN
jgi:hypothetical protein